MSLSVGTTYEGRNFSYLKKILPYVQHIEISPDSLAYKSKDEVAIRPDCLEELIWMQQNSAANLLVHGISLSIGSYDGYSKEYIKLLDQLFGNLNIKWHSEHLAYTTVNGEALGTMLTLPRTTETVDLICRRVDSIQKRFKVPFLLENVINMLPMPPSSYTDAAFLNKICSLTGCGLILDVYNMECDAHNFGLNILSFLDELDLNNVYELHVASGQTDPDSNFMMDIHAGLVADSTLDLTGDIIQRNPKKLGAITFEILDEFIERISPESIIEELIKIDQIVNKSYEPANASS